MPDFLDVPEMGIRRRSEGCLEAFQSNGLVSCRCKQCEEGVGCVKHDAERPRERSATTAGAGVESNLMDVLRKNYDIVSALADIETSESCQGNHQMRGPASRIFCSSPRPLVLKQNIPSKCSCEFENMSISTEVSEENAPDSMWSRLSNEMKWFLYDIAEAFDAPPQEQKKQVKAEQQKLSAVALRRDLKRCYSFLHPLVEVAAAIYDTLLWKNPMHTLLLALVYTYSIVRGWTASLVLLLLWTQLSLNYLKATRNVDIGLCFLPRKEVAMPKFDITGAQLIFDVAKIAQKLLSFAANFLEKLHSLLTWKDHQVTFVFYCLVIYWLALSMIFNTGTCLGMCGLTLGVRIFITTYLFHRFPLLRKRLDTYGWFYRNLPVKGSRDQSPLLTVSTEPLPSLAAKSASPMARRPEKVSGLFTSRLGSNFNLDTTGSQLSLNSQRHNSFSNFLPRGSIPNLTNFKGSYDALSERAGPALARVQWAINGHSDSVASEPPLITFKPSRAGISPLATEQQRSPSPPLDPPASEVGPSGEEFDDMDAGKSSSLSVYSNDDEMSVHEDGMIDNILAYRSCVMHDKEKTFPKGISSGILYLTTNALIYRSKSTSDDRAPVIMLFADLISVKRIQALRTMGLLTGTRKSLEIHMEGRRKPLQFIGLAQRDDFFARVQTLCERDTSIVFI
ncbi:hypothetical protein Q1695_005975 [Nippostrongylus brasiliensis]|nr:hypothetical protein Q1695_005975 [Nippostrongylus brasiliensis]